MGGAVGRVHKVYKWGGGVRVVLFGLVFVAFCLVVFFFSPSYASSADIKNKRDIPSGYEPY